MPKNSRHSVKVVWDNPSEEANLTYPKRDFMALNRQVQKRKRLIRLVKGAAIVTLIIGALVIISLSKRSKKQPEVPVSSIEISPRRKSASSYNWSMIGTIRQKNLPVGVPEIEVIQKAAVQQPPQGNLVIKKVNNEVSGDVPEKVSEAIDTIQTKNNTPILSDELKVSSDSSTLVKKAFVPSEFTRAYPKVGYDSLYQYLTEYINQELLGSKNDGDTLRISFAIEADGHPSGIKLSISTADSIFMKIEEVVQQMPTWEPAKADGQPIVTRFRLPLIIQSKTIKE